MRKLLSTVGAVIIFIFVGSLIYMRGVVLSDFWTQLAVGLFFLAIGILGWGFKSELNYLVKGKAPKFDPRYDHVEAWLFYGPEISYEKGERDPKKNNPRSKLVCNTITKKAYYVNRDVWEMIRGDRIRYHTDDEQDLEEWCKNMGYELVKRDAREYDLLDRGN